MRHLDVLNLRGRKVPQDHGREQERSGSDRNTELDEGFGSTEETEGGFAEEFIRGREGIRNKEPNPAKHVGDEGNKGEKAKIENELEKANSYKSKDESETVDLVRMFDSETTNQQKSKRIGSKRSSRPDQCANRCTTRGRIGV